MQTFNLTVDPKKVRVDIGMPVHSGFIPYPTAAALAETVKTSTKHGFDVRLLDLIGSSIIIDARSGVVDKFLAGDGTHLFWIDADMHWQSLDFLRIVALCTQVDVVGAAYCQKREPVKVMVRGLPKNTPNDFGLLEVEGLGLGFVCMRREVVEKVAADKPIVIANGGSTPIKEVFTFGKTAEGYRYGEDMRFFEDIRNLGYKIWLDPMVSPNHVGIKMYGTNVADALGLEPA